MAMYGDRHPYRLHYFLEDDTVEILEVHEGNSGRDPFPVFLRRAPLPKVMLAMRPPERSIYSTSLGCQGMLPPCLPVAGAPASGLTRHSSSASSALLGCLGSSGRSVPSCLLGEHPCFRCRVLHRVQLRPCWLGVPAEGHLGDQALQQLHLGSLWKSVLLSSCSLLCGTGSQPAGPILMLSTVCTRGTQRHACS